MYMYFPYFKHACMWNSVDIDLFEVVSTHCSSFYMYFLALLLGSLRMPYKDVRSLVLGVSDTLGEQMLEQLLKYMPKREEMDSLAPFKNKINELSDAEQFAVVVCH